ncbi:MAG: hypothetical protein ACJ75H_03225, partial [Thermoanaerobaculia bacterium]
MARDKDNTSELRAVTGAIRIGKRLRPRDSWDRAMEAPLLWLPLLLVLGTWCLLPGAFLFSNRAVPGTIADRDYVASRDLLLDDEEATRAKQREARERVLPVYDLDPGIIAERDAQVAQLFSRNRRLLARAEGDAAAREAIVRGLTAAPSSPEDLKLTSAQAELLTRKSFSSEL